MKYDRNFLENVHNDIKANMAATGLEPHRRPQNLISHFTYDCDFYTLRYWRSNDTAWLTDHWYNQSCLELLVYNNKLYIGIWFGLNNKDASKLNKHKHEIMDKCREYPEYTWADGKETPAPTDEKLIQWLCETSHETVFRKELASYNKDAVVSEMRHLKEYLDVLL